MSAIFISHSAEDSDLAIELRDWLEDQKFKSLFLDFDASFGIEAGQDWEQEIYRELRACEAVIVVCTPRTLTSKWCFAEITHARALGKPVFPVKFEDCEVEGLLSDSQLIDLSADGKVNGFARLSDGLIKAGIDPRKSIAWNRERTPFPGLASFQEEDAAIFFGRDEEISTTLSELNRLHNFGGCGAVFILGASGSGKSSIIRAGVVPRLRRDESRWLVLDPVRTRGAPLTELAACLTRAFVRYADRQIEPERLALELSQSADRYAVDSEADIQLTGGERSLTDVVMDLRASSQNCEASVVLIIDQFEELFAEPNREGASRVFALIRHALAEKAPLIVVGTMRSDFLGMLQQSLPLGSDFSEVLIGPISPANLSDAVERPAELAGIAMEPGLVQRLLQDAGSSDSLPLLAFALRELYERGLKSKALRLSDYEHHLKGLQGVVADVAESLLDGLAPSVAEEQQLRSVFLQLVRLNPENQLVARAVEWTAVPQSIHPLLERFVQARLLVTSQQDDGRRVFEVAHEALFRSWTRLRDWLEQEHDLLAWQRRVELALLEWQRAAQSPELLLRAQSLTEAEQWLARRKESIPVRIAEFIRCSIAARSRAQRKRRVRAVCALVIVLAIVALAVWGAALLKEYQRRLPIVPEMVSIEARGFAMGSPADQMESIDTERPVHAVQLEKFAIGRHEVTFAEYERCVEANVCPQAADNGWGKGVRPVITVSWHDAKKYASWLSERTGDVYRLPSEAEWEYAARAGTDTRFWWGDDIGENHANCSGCGSDWDDEKTAPVGTFPPNGFGLTETAGNVWEWTSDCWHDSYVGAPTNGKSWSSPNTRCKRVVKGGSWGDLPDKLRPSGRNWYYETTRTILLGFRLVREL